MKLLTPFKKLHLDKPDNNSKADLGGDSEADSDSDLGADLDIYFNKDSLSQSIGDYA
jgi:hypothetical protein